MNKNNNKNASWDRVSTLFAAAAELPPERRQEFLSAACGQDPALRAEVESLLAVHDIDPDFLHRPGAEVHPRPPDDAVGAAGQVVGGYQLLHRIGHGGMAEVYFAERQHQGAAQGVAVKLLHAGFSHPEIIERFRREQRILAGFDHPGVSRLLDSGTADDGRLYLVTDFIEGGEPLDQHCDRQRLGVRERLRLFVQLCEAVQYVHQRLVVHGDLKPDNVLVSAEGQVRLLDFGIASLLVADPDTVTQLTGALPRPITPAYASPEQVRGESPTIASDIYTLGVVLYELLCGVRPYATTTRNPAELERIVAHTLPEPPSRRLLATEAVKRGEALHRLSRVLRGDLDTIALQAMAKHPASRYATVVALAEDLQRYLGGFPVRARRLGRIERATKFLRRNPVSSAAGVTALLAISVLLGGALHYNLRISRQAEELRQALGRAEATTGFLTGLFESTNPTRRITLESTTGDLLALGTERLLDDPDIAEQDRAAILTVVGSVYETLGKYELTREVLEQALAIYRAEPVPSLAFVRALTEYANVSYRQGDFVAAERLSAEALAQALIAIPERLSTLCSIRNTLGLSLWSQARYDEAEAVLAEAVRGRRELAATDTTGELATALQSLGGVYDSQDRFDEAEAAYREAEQIFIRDVGSDNPRLAFLLLDIAILNNRRERPEGNVELLQRAIAISDQSLGPGHPFAGAAQGILARVHYRAGRYPPALEAQQAGLEIFEATVPATHHYIGESRVTLGQILLKLDDPNAALPHLEAGLAIVSGHPPSTKGLPGAMASLAEALIATGQATRAVEVIDQARARADAIELAPDHPDRVLLEALAAKVATGA